VDRESHGTFGFFAGVAIFLVVLNLIPMILRLVFQSRCGVCSVSLKCQEIHSAGVVTAAERKRSQVISSISAMILKPVGVRNYQR
jgi:hypothetical protein